MKALLSELAEVAGARLEGDAECVIQAVNTLSDARQGDIAFLTNERYRKELSSTRASAVILKEAFVDDCPVNNKIISDNPYLSYALIAKHLAPDMHRVPDGIHPTAIIDKTASIAADACIGALVVVGENVKINANVSIGSGSVIGDNCILGKDSLIAANVTLYAGVTIGERCLIHSGAVLGGDGFGFANDHGNWVKIPQTGGVVLGNNVEVGVNTAIDRGAIHDTVIEDGVKLDNLIQIGHNVHLGKNTAIAASAAIAGSTKIGGGCTIGGVTGIAGHLNITDNVHISGKTAVIKSISEAGHYTGTFPAMPHQLWAKNMVRLRQLDELNKRINALEKKMNEQK